MKLREFKDKEDLINDELYQEQLDEDFMFYEIDFYFEEVYLVEEVKDFDYGRLDFEDRKFTFKELEEYNEGQLMKILIDKIEGLN